MSKMEEEAKEEAWGNWAQKDFERALEKKFDVTFDEVDSDKLRELFEKALERSNTEWINEQGGEMWVDLKRTIDKGVLESDLNELGATYVEDEFDDNGPGLYIVHGERPRRSEETVFESFEEAESEASEILRHYLQQGKAVVPPVAILEARSRADALEGKGHVWWIDGVQHGPSVDPRQTALSFDRSKKHRKSSKRRRS